MDARNALSRSEFFGSITALKKSMKTFLLVGLTVAALCIWQRNVDHPAAERKSGDGAIAAAPPARTISAHNWAKHSLDRAHEVAAQVQESREDNQP